MLTLRQSRMAAAPAFLRGGFRPFFFGGAVWAIVALTLWLTALAGATTLPSALEPLVWHRHEMLFGFVGAVVAGFLLTAIPNWTGRLPIAGASLASLFGLWALARLAVLCSAEIGQYRCRPGDHRLHPLIRAGIHLHDKPVTGARGRSAGQRAAPQDLFHRT
jgi:uncharacterized protein involved in response to NO